jgi:hypothetical protein
LEAALSNANEARKVVFELFQDLDRFSLEDYQPLSDVDEGKARILEFVRTAVPDAGGTFEQVGTDRYRVGMPEDAAPRLCTLDRDLAQQDDSIELLGIDHPVVSCLALTLCELPPTSIGVSVRLGIDRPGVVTIWQVQVYEQGNESGTHIIPIAAGFDGKRAPSLEKSYGDAFRAAPAPSLLEPASRSDLLGNAIEPMLVREINHRGLASPDGGYSSKLLAWVEVV